MYRVGTMEVREQLEKGKGPSTHNFQPSPNFYLRAQIRYILSIIDHIVPRKFRYEVQERLRDLVIELRNSKGHGAWEMACAALFLIGIGIFAMSLRETGYIYSAPHNKFRVIEQVNDYDFVLQRVENGIA